jgi:hypothetical protein
MQYLKVLAIYIGRGIYLMRLVQTRGKGSQRYFEKNSDLRKLFESFLVLYAG